MKRACCSPSRWPFFQRFVPLVLLVAGLVGSGCGDEAGSSYDVGGLLGTSSTFEMTAEGVVEDALTGAAVLRTDDAGKLIGIDLVHIDDSTRGLSIELEPQPIAPDTYKVVPPGLLGVERAGQSAGLTAFFESETHSFRATRGTLRVTQAGGAYVQGTFDLQMSGRPEGGSFSGGDVTVQGAFRAVRPES